MNRQYKRMAKKMGMADEQGQPTPQQRPTRSRKRGKRTGPVTFFKQVLAELKKVVWPTRPEVTNYTFVTILALTFVGAFIFVLDYIFVRGANWLYK